jgi:thiamine biosynthesis lipoprotein
LLPAGGGHLARSLWDFTGATMGTHWRARLVQPDHLTQEAAAALLRDTFAFVVARMSPWEPDSDLSRYCRAAAGEWVQLDPATFTVLHRALEVAALTGGLYDPTIGRLTDTLGFGPTDPAQAALPDSPATALARATVGHARVQLDPARHAALQPGDLQLDLCAIAKGYAIDLALDRLQAAGVQSCFIEIGGEARGLGCKPDGQPWWCLIEPPAHPDHGLPETVAAACNLALATSGNSRRLRSLPSSQLGHIISPLAEHPLDPTLETVTVTAPTCMEADVFATALFLLGAERGCSFAATHGISALFVERQPTGHRETWSPRFAELLS